MKESGNNSSNQNNDNNNYNDNRDIKDIKNSKDRDEWSKKYAVIAVYAFIVIAAGFAAVMVIRWVFDFFSQKQYSGIFKVLTPIIYGFVIAYLLNPLLMFFDGKVFYKIKKKLRHIFSLLSTYILAVIIITLLILMVVPQVLSSINQLAGMITDWFSPIANVSGGDNGYTDVANGTNGTNGEDNIGNSDSSDNIDNTNNTDSINNIEDIDNIEDIENLIINSKIVIFLTDFANSLQGYVDGYGLDVNIKETINNMIPDIADSLMNLGKNSVAIVINVTLSMIYGLASGLWNIILGILLSVYLLISKDRFIAQVKKLLFAFFPNGFSYKLIKVMRQTHEIFGGFITGKIVESLIVGIICFAGMWIFRIPYAVLISVIVAVTNVIPFFGSFLGAIISVFFLVIADIKQALIFTVFILILQQFDGNFLGPKILGPKVGLPAFLVICAVLIMGGFYGFPGMVIGVPIFAVIYTLIKEYAESRLERKGFPIKTEYYIKNIAGSENFGDIIGGDEDYTSNINKDRLVSMRIETSENEDGKTLFYALSKTVKNIAGKLGRASNNTVNIVTNVNDNSDSNNSNNSNDSGSGSEKGEKSKRKQKSLGNIGITGIGRNNRNNKAKIDDNNVKK